MIVVADLIPMRPSSPSTPIATAITTMAVVLGLTGSPLAGSAVASAETVNGKIAYATAGLGEIFAVGADGTNTTRLTRTEKIESDAVFSPDGRRLAVVRFPPREPDDLYVIEADGSGSSRLTRARQEVESPAWSADGAKILFLSDRDGDLRSEIYAINPDGSGSTRLAEDADLIDERPTLSTASDKVAYASFDGSDTEIVVIDLDGSDKLVLTDDPGSDVDPVLSPDGGTIAWTSNRSGDPEIYTMSSDGSNVVRLTFGGALDPDFSADGQRIAYTALNQGFGTRAVVANADGSGPLAVSRPAQNALALELSPNSRRLAYGEILPLPGEDPQFNLFSTAIDGAASKKLTRRRDLAIYADWQPLAEAEPDPPLSLTVKPNRARRGRPPTARFSCSNECDLVVVGTTKRRKGGLRSRARRHLVGNDPVTVTVLERKLLGRIPGRRARVRVSARARDDFGHRDQAKTAIRVTGI